MRKRARESRKSYAKARKKLRKRFRTHSIHHIDPRSRNGSDSKYNLFPWDDSMHSAWHKIFRHMTISEIWEVFDTVWDSVFNNSASTVIPSWWAVCPFSPSEAHVSGKPVEASFFQEAWLECFGTKELERSRCLLKLILLYLVLDGALNSRFNRNNFKQLRRIIIRIRSGSSREWAFKMCFNEDRTGDPDQLVRVEKMTREIISQSPYSPR